jgi:hypothetical protein
MGRGAGAGTAAAGGTAGSTAASVGWLDEAVVDLEVEARLKDLTALLPADIRKQVRLTVSMFV